jgi:hypothetical protein
MYLAGFLSAAGRRIVFALGFAAILLAAPLAALAQDKPAAQAPPDDFNFAAADAGMIIWHVPADKAAAFEEAWTAILAKLKASDKPEHKEVATTLKIYKPTAPAAGQPISYFFVASPSSKTASYSPVKLVFESGLFGDPNNPKDRPGIDEVFNKFPLPGKVEGANISVLPLKAIQ